MARVFDSVVLSTVSPSTAVTSPQLTHQIMARLPLLTTVCMLPWKPPLVLQAKPVNKDRYISKMFLRGDSVILVLRNPLATAQGK